MGIAGIKERIRLGEVAQGRIVVARTEVIQVGGLIELLAGEEVMDG